MIKKIVFFIMLFIMVVSAKRISFQLYVYDNINKDPLFSNEKVTIDFAFVDPYGNKFFSKTESQNIEDGIIHFSLDVDTTNFYQLAIFDIKDLQLEVSLLNDVLKIPMSAVPISIISQLADRTFQLKDPSLMSIDYLNRKVNIGTGPLNNKETLNINGTLTATNFVGDGKQIYNAKGGGLSDDHSLEKNLSRTCPPNIVRQDCKYGEDILFIDNSPFVGINTKNPKMHFDMLGTVYFTTGETNTGTIDFPLSKYQSLMAWDHQTAAFKAGYVSRDVSVKLDTFSRSTVSIGVDSATIGRYSSIFGGENNTIFGNYSGIIGGKSNTVTGNYSVLVGAYGDTINNGYVTNIGGGNNIISSNFTVLVSSQQNRLNGSYQTVVGENNLANGESVIIYGSNNEIKDINFIRRLKINNISIQNNRTTCCTICFFKINSFLI